CLTSDTLFIEEIYQNSTLENASEYYLIDWLEKEDIKKILKEENFNEKEIDYAINYLSLPYEITELINNKKLGLTVEETIKKWINIERDKLIYLLKTNRERKENLLRVLNKFKNSIKVSIGNFEDEIFEDTKFLIKNEILFYDIINGIIKPTSIKKWYAIKKLLK
ncbi:ATP-binding protein, partial [Methanocaldococcus infernus]